MGLSSCAQFGHHHGSHHAKKQCKDGKSCDLKKAHSKKCCKTTAAEKKACKGKDASSYDLKKKAKKS